MIFFLQGSCTRKAQFLFTPLLFTGYYRPRVGKSPIVIPCSLCSISKLLHPFTIACFASFVILDCLIVNISLFVAYVMEKQITFSKFYDFHVNNIYALCKSKSLLLAWDENLTSALIVAVLWILLDFYNYKKSNILNIVTPNIFSVTSNFILMFLPWQ